MPIDSDYDWPPRMPSEMEFEISKRMALKALCELEPSAIDLVVEKDLFVLNTHFEIGLHMNLQQLNVSLGMTISGNINGSNQQVPVGVVRRIIRTQVTVREDLVAAVLAKLANEDGDIDLRVIANRLIGQASVKLPNVLEAQCRYDELEKAEEKLRSAYMEILAGRLPQNSE